MSILDNMKEVADLVKKLGDIELYRRITTLETEVIDLTRAKRHLEEENEQLKELINTKQKMAFKVPFWFIEGDTVPHCPRCWESDKKAIHLHGPSYVASGSLFECPQCGKDFISERSGQY